MLEALKVAAQHGQILPILDFEGMGRVLDHVCEQRNRRFDHGIDIDFLCEVGRILPHVGLQVIDNLLNSPGPVGYAGEQCRQTVPHFSIVHAADNKLAVVAVVVFQNRQGTLPGLFDNFGVQHDEIVRIVYFMRHTGNERSDRHHLAGLHELVLVQSGQFFGFLACRDVTGDAAKPRGPPLGVFNQRYGNLEDIDLTVFADGFPVDRSGGHPGAVDLVKGPVKFLGRFRTHVLPVIHAHEFIGIVA